MISVEYLMIGVHRHFQIVIGKAAVKVQKPGVKFRSGLISANMSCSLSICDWLSEIIYVS